MTYAGTIADTRNAFTAAPEYGVSEDANILTNYVNCIINDYMNAVTATTRREQMRLALFEMMEECSEDNWDGYGAHPVRLEAVREAWRFLNTLPITTPLPEVSADPDGEVSFEWYIGPGKVFSTSIGVSGQLTYAGLFGSNKAKGTEYFGDELPRTILENIKRVLT